MVCCNVLVINTPIGRQAAHDDRYMQRAANEGIAALQRQQQVVVIALHRRFMSLGGGTFLRRLPQLAIFKMEMSRQAVAMLRHEHAGVGVDFMTIQELIGHCDSKPALSLLTQSIV
jgi:site-specific recombinase XerD